MNTDKQALIKALKKKRESEGLSIRALSERVGISFSSLARIERGEGEIRKGTRDAESAKARRLAIESDYKDAARIDDERAAEESVS